MSYYVVQDNGAAMGFSLKPPKWLRKMKPGKYLIPAAAIGAAFLIPGVGGAVVGGLTAATKAIGGVVSGALKGVTTSVAGSIANPQVGTPPIVAPQLPAAQQPLQSVTSTGGQPVAAAPSFPVVPVAIALGVVALLAHRNR